MSFTGNKRSVMGFVEEGSCRKVQTFWALEILLRVRSGAAGGALWPLGQGEAGGDRVAARLQERLLRVRRQGFRAQA